MEQIKGTALAQPRFNTLLTISFSFLALILALLGLFAVIAYSVSQRTREFGVRMALGARRQDILGLVVKYGMQLAFAGLLAGVFVSVIASRLVRQFLFQVQPFDLGVYLSLCIVLLSVAILAVYVPARRATKVDPIQTLRYE